MCSKTTDIPITIGYNKPARRTFPPDNTGIPYVLVPKPYT